jgi:hypothetical protein
MRSGTTRKNNPLLRSLTELLWVQFLAPIPPRLCLIAFTFCQPLLLNRVLQYLTDSKQEPNINVGYGLIGAYGIVYLGLAVRLTPLMLNISLNLDRYHLQFIGISTINLSRKLGEF